MTEFDRLKSRKYSQMIRHRRNIETLQYFNQNKSDFLFLQKDCDCYRVPKEIQEKLFDFLITYEQYLLRVEKEEFNELNK